MTLPTHKVVNHGEYDAIGVVGPAAVYDHARRRVLCGGVSGGIAWQWVRVSCEDCLKLKQPVPMTGAQLQRLAEEVRDMRKEVHQVLAFMAKLSRKKSRKKA